MAYGVWSQVDGEGLTLHHRRRAFAAGRNQTDDILITLKSEAPETGQGCCFSFTDDSGFLVLCANCRCALLLRISREAEGSFGPHAPT